jgi:hypothetical protein
MFPNTIAYIAIGATRALDAAGGLTDQTSDLFGGETGLIATLLNSPLVRIFAMLFPWLATPHQRRFLYAGALSQLCIFVISTALASEDASYSSIVIVCAMSICFSAGLVSNSAKACVLGLALTLGGYALVQSLNPVQAEPSAALLSDLMRAIAILPAIGITAILTIASAGLLANFPSANEGATDAHASVHPAYGLGGIKRCVRSLPEPSIRVKLMNDIGGSDPNPLKHQSATNDSLWLIAGFLVFFPLIGALSACFYGLEAGLKVSLAIGVFVAVTSWNFRRAESATQ